MIMKGNTNDCVLHIWPIFRKIYTQKNTDIKIGKIKRKQECLAGGVPTITKSEKIQRPTSVVLRSMSGVSKIHYARPPSRRSGGGGP